MKRLKVVHQIFILIICTLFIIYVIFIGFVYLVVKVISSAYPILELVLSLNLIYGSNFNLTFKKGKNNKLIK
jgi:hypothetical protein